MDVVEQGYETLLERIRELKEKKGELADDVKKNEAGLLERMATSAKPLISQMGLNMLSKGKKDGKGEIYDANYYEKRMFILGKTDPVPFRPDALEKKVESQYCVIGEDGQLYELMYSHDELLIDSYLNPLQAREAIELYGYDVLFMLYRALREYMKEEEELVRALGRTLEYVFEFTEKPQ
jgi:hypothetical protein